MLKVSMQKSRVTMALVAYDCLTGLKRATFSSTIFGQAEIAVGEVYRSGITPTCCKHWIIKTAFINMM